jgi:thymidine kinase
MENGKIILILGPMFAGKTTKLIELVNRYTIMKKKTIVIKYQFDERYTTDNKIVTHDNKEYPAMPMSSITPQLEALGEYDVIGIDEAQFYSDVRKNVNIDTCVLSEVGNSRESCNLIRPIWII